MDFSRNERIAEEIKKGISEIINSDLKDPRIEGLISVTKVKVTKDLGHATVFISFYGDKAKRDTTFAVIQNAKNFIRHELAGKIRIKYMPELSFRIDESIEYGIHINKLLEEIKKQKQEEKEDK